MRNYLVFIVTVLACAALWSKNDLRVASRSASAEDDPGLSEVAIPILGPMRRIQGLGDPQRFAVDPQKFATDPFRSFDYLHPSRLKLRLPDGKSVTMDVSSLSLTGEHGLVRSVYLRRPLKPAPFKDMMVDLKQTLKELGIEPGRNMREHMAGWPEDRPTPGENADPLPYDYTTGSPAFEGVHLNLVVSASRGQGWFYLLIFAAESEVGDSAQAIVRLTTFTGYKSDGRELVGPRRKTREDEPGEGLPDVAVSIPGTPQQVGGMQLSEADHKLSLGYPDAREPHHLAVKLNDDRILKLDARASSLLYDRGVVTGIHVRRPMQPVPFPEAVADVRATLAQLGVEPDAAMIAQMAEWPEAAQGFGETFDPPDFHADAAISPDVRLTVRVLADPKGGWFTLYTLNASKEARARVRKARGIPEQVPR